MDEEEKEQIKKRFKEGIQKELEIQHEPINGQLSPNTFPPILAMTPTVIHLCKLLGEQVRQKPDQRPKRKNGGRNPKNGGRNPISRIPQHPHPTSQPKAQMSNLLAIRQSGRAVKEQKA